MTKSVAQSLLYSLGDDRRTVVADWRIRVLMQRYSLDNPCATDARSVAKQISGMLQRHELATIPSCQGIYRVNVPFAKSLPCPDEAIAQECNPSSYLSYVNALAYHNLTYELPLELQFVSVPKMSLTPVGTTPDDWDSELSPPSRTPTAIGERNVRWGQSQCSIGIQVGRIEGLPVYVSDLERTLIDSLRFPENCGGVSAALEAWQKARQSIRLDRIIEYANALGINLLKQRLGFVLEALDFSHPQFEDWAASATRGSSAKLVAPRAFSSTFSERWSLSINATETELALLKDCK